MIHLLNYSQFFFTLDPEVLNCSMIFFALTYDCDLPTSEEMVVSFVFYPWSLEKCLLSCQFLFDSKLQTLHWKTFALSLWIVSTWCFFDLYVENSFEHWSHLKLFLVLVELWTLPLCCSRLRLLRNFKGHSSQETVGIMIESSVVLCFEFKCLLKSPLWHTLILQHFQYGGYL